jgi:hypothetical protein
MDAGVGINNHGPKLADDEQAAALANTLLTEQHWTWGRQTDKQGHSSKQREKQQHENNGYHDIQNALHL